MTTTMMTVMMLTLMSRRESARTSVGQQQCGVGGTDAEAYERTPTMTVTTARVPLATAQAALTARARTANTSETALV